MNSKEELNAMTHEYIDPKPDRVIDIKILDLISDFVISEIEGDDVLELGIGSATWTPKLIKKFKRVTTVDASSELIELSKKKFTQGNWKSVFSYFEEYRPQERFDVVFATYILEHVKDPLLIMKSAEDFWLKPKGRFVLVVPHALSLHRRLATIMGISVNPGDLKETDRRMGHTHCFTYLEIEKLLNDAGFKILDRKGMFTKVLPNEMLTHCSDQQLRGLFSLGFELPIEYSAAIYYLAESP